MKNLRRCSARPTLVMSVVGLSLVGFTLACRPATTPRVPTAVADPFVVVRATAEAAYQSGEAHLNRGELEAALVDLDTAKTNDADNRQDIQQALDQAISSLAAETPTPTATTVPRTVVVATVPAIANTATTPGLTTAPAGAAVTPTSGVADLVAWRDPQGRFSVSAPADWVTDAHSQGLFGVGTGVIQFRDPTGRSEFDVAVDTTTRAVSPELYSAGLELALEQQVPGYAAELMQPDSTAGNPSMRRVFSFTQRDAGGHDIQARGFQVTVVKGSTAYVISGSAPAEQFTQASSTFDRMVETFRLS